jgi:hypothetical protein
MRVFYVLYGLFYAALRNREWRESIESIILGKNLEGILSKGGISF